LSRRHSGNETRDARDGGPRDDLDHLEHRAGREEALMLKRAKAQPGETAVLE
jgi:hypothetical protein